MKLGKKAPTYDHRDLQFAHYRDSMVLPLRPRVFGHESLVPDFGMLGNDGADDCTCAGADHEEMLWTAEATGSPAVFTTEDALGDYGAITGFRADDPSTDQGAVVRDVLAYRKATGMKDATGKRHKIAVYVALEPGNLQHVLEASYLFSCVGIGIEFPGSAMTQFNKGKPWSVVHGARVEGGHYIPIVGFDGTDLLVVTWGKVQRMTKGFFAKYCDEAWAMLSLEDFGPDGKTIDGFDLAQLKADLQAVA